MTKDKWLRWVCIAIALLVAFSRMYLGVHTPLDVGVSLVLATEMVLVLWPIVNAAERKPQVMGWLLLALLAVCGAFVAFLYVFPFPTDVDADTSPTRWKTPGS